MKRYDLINLLIEKKDYTSYLEVGIHEGVCFNKVNCLHKVGVDIAPLISDERIITTDSATFFAHNKETFDIIFIDASHNGKDALLDAVLALAFLNEGGMIVMHDCAPTKESETIVPRPKPHGRWNGDVYKAWIVLRKTLGKRMQVVDIDEGCGIIYKSEFEDPLNFDDEINFETYINNRVELLNLVSYDTFYNSL